MIISLCDICEQIIIRVPQICENDKQIGVSYVKSPNAIIEFLWFLYLYKDKPNERPKRLHNNKRHYDRRLTPNENCGYCVKDACGTAKILQF